MRPTVNHVLRATLSFCTGLSLAVGAVGASSQKTGLSSDGVTLQLARRIEAAQADYLAARHTILQRINQWFHIDYEALYRRYDAHDREYRQQLEAVEKIQDDEAKRKEMIEKGFAQAKKFDWSLTGAETLAVYEANLRKGKS